MEDPEKQPTDAKKHTMNPVIISDKVPGVHWAVSEAVPVLEIGKKPVVVYLLTHPACDI